MFRVHTQWRNRWTVHHIDHVTLDDAVAFARAATTTPWRVVRGKKTYAEGHAKRIYRQEQP